MHPCDYIFLLLFGAPILHHNFLGLLSLLAVSPPDGDCGVIFSAAVAFWHGCGRSTVVSPIPSGSCCPLEKHIVVIFILMQSLSVQQCNNHSNKILSSLSLSSSALLLRLLFWHHLPLTVSSQYSVLLEMATNRFAVTKTADRWTTAAVPTKRQGYMYSRTRLQRPPIFRTQ